MSRPTVCFSGYAGVPEVTEDDRPAAAALAAAGVTVDYVAWDHPGVDWPGFDAVVVRTTWDYHLRIEEFRAWIDARAEDGTNLWNPPRVLAWNADKRYLERFARSGVPVVPTEWVRAGDVAELGPILERRGWERAVVKPVVSAGGHRTHVVDAGARDDDDVRALLEEQDAMVQPFLHEIVTDGELSMVFFGGRLSHSVVKRATTGEFRVQPRHGGTVHDTDPAPATIVAARRVLDLVEDDLLYARVDGIVRDGTFLLIELEVLEPILFFGQDPDSPSRFADALLRRLRPRSGARPSSSRAGS